MDLDQYLKRIGFRGRTRADVATLRQLHRRHLEAIPYESLDVPLGRPVGFDIEAVFHKLVLSARGGWCYEMNGLMAWALEQIGFRFTRLAGAVLRDRLGDSTIGTHLALCVHLDEPWLVDVGFGDGLIEPAALVAGPIRQEFLDFRLEDLGDGWWRFHNHPQGGAATFDFQLSEASPAALAQQCQWLQTAPESGFVRTAVCQRFIDGTLLVLRGCVFKTIREHEVVEQVLESASDYRDVLISRFGIDVPDLERLWEKVSARHAEWLRA